MNTLEAKEILSRHNEWRRGAEIEQTDPTQLGIAIDVAVNAMQVNNLLKRRCTFCGVDELFTDNYCNCCGAKQ